MPDERPGSFRVRSALAVWLAAFLVTNVVAGIVLGAGGYVGDGAPDPPLWLVAVLQVPLWATLGAGLVLVSRREGTGAVARDFRLRATGRDVAVGVGIGLVTQALVVPLLYLPLGAWIDREDVEAPARALTDRAEGIGVAVLAVLVVVGAPLVEELFYRGLLLTALEGRIGRAGGLWVSALLFGAAHFQLLQLPALVVFGLVAGLARQRTGRLGPSIAAHAAFNAYTVVALLATR